MNKWNKIILTGLCVGFAALVAMSAYLIYDNKSAPETKTVSMNAANVHKTGKSVSRPRPLDFDDDSAGLKKDAPSAGSKKTAKGADAYVFYPDAVMKTLGIDMKALLAGRDKFKSTIIHVEWMDRINDTLKNLDPDKKEAMIKNHATLLYIKDKLNESYLTGKIDFDTFKKSLADLMKWHQKTYEAMLSPAEYETLFEVKPEDAGRMIDDLISATPEYSFILNQRIPIEEVKKRVQGFKLEEVNTHFKKMAMENETIGNKINSGEMTLEQARQALSVSQQAFISKCKEILTEDEINIIFGSVKGLESGAINVEGPKVLGDTDEAQLGFAIENPNTSIKMVTQKIDKNKIEDVKFFFQERAKERKKLLEKLDAGEITEDELTNISADMDATFEDNCKGVLTEAEYKLLFDKSEPPATGSDDENKPGK